MKIASLFIISSSLIFGSSIAINIPPRVFGQCAQLSLNDLYCFGGRSSNKDGATVFKDMYRMDLKSFSGYTPSEIANNWQPLGNEMLQPNSDFLMMELSTDLIMIVGGSGSVNNSSTPYTYDTVKKAWGTVSPTNLKSAIPPL